MPYNRAYCFRFVGTTLHHGQYLLKVSQSLSKVRHVSYEAEAVLIN